MTVADLLAQSRAAHAEYRRSAGAADKKGNIIQTYDEAKCLPAIERAMSLRQQAHELDPEHVDPEWAQDKASHDELMFFYRKFVA